MIPTTVRTGRIPLLACTLGLALLTARSIRSTPPALAWALPPYLALVAATLLARPGRSADAPLAADPPAPEPLAPPPGPEPVAVAPAGPIEPGAIPGPAPALPTRPRRRPRPRPAAEPAPAAWVQVGPGRFVRGEPPEPAPGPPEPPGFLDESAVEDLSAPASVDDSPGGPREGGEAI